MGKVIYLYKDSNEGIKMECNKSKDNLLQLAKLIIFFANNTTSNLYKTKLNKLLFYTQFLCYKMYNIRLLDDEFICDYHGPVLSCMDDYLSYLKKLAIVKIIETNYGTTIQSNVNLPINEYSEEEKNILEKVLKNFDKYTASDISDYSHKEPLWIDTPLKNIISLSEAYKLNELLE